MEILSAEIQDAQELLNIYAPYVKETAVSFEYDVPSVEEFAKRIENISKSFPYLKAVENGEILGYAYAGEFKGRRAYDWAVETTIYLKPSERRHGVGRALYEALEDRLKNMGILNMNACIALPPSSDPHLNMDSIYFHRKMGFESVGTFHNIGYKFDTWYDMIWMEKMIGDHKKNQPCVKFGIY